MASGYGLNGGPSRCFPFWQEVLACYVLSASPENPEGKAKCQLPLEDYYECLHHKKEYIAKAKLQAVMRQKEATTPRPESAPKPQEVRTLGMIDAPMEEKGLKQFWIFKPKPPTVF
ncbi:hypothetical protein HDK77DRAFT_503764 [Phyllosticta capitalensis]|uniref:NADH dehydrogenase [ubiquinone] iron-sulfur protein 5 n=1 Tax=Phyllosticta capitalensis TaxID=121624 RepID=A0ABR1Z2L1_9PEZI